MADLASALRRLGPEYADYESALREANYKTVLDVRAASPELLHLEAGVPIAPARTIFKELSTAEFGTAGAAAAGAADTPVLGRRIISLQALEKVRQAIFLIKETAPDADMSSSTDSDASHRDYVGVGVFVKPRRAVTVAHNLLGLKPGDPVDVVVPNSKRRLRLKVLKVDAAMDYAVLGSLEDSEFLELWSEDAMALLGTELVLCAFQLGIHEELPEFSTSLGVMPAVGSKLSRNRHFMVYTASTWPGDSGGTLVMANGQLVGLHKDGVNALRERFDRMAAVGERLDSVEESLEAAARSVNSGCVAVLNSAFAADLEEA